MRTLLVDDVADLRLVVRMVLERDGRFEVVGEATDGREGVALADELQPDLVLLDLSMPEMDGLEALPRILTVAPEARVVIFSGFVEERVGRQALALGAEGYIEKGVDPRTMLDQLTDLLWDGEDASTDAPK